MQRLALILLKLSIQFICWVFVLSIEWNGTTLFSRARSLLVDNSYTSALKVQALEASTKVGSKLALLIHESRASLDGSDKAKR
jgi:hypothetical protein